MNPQSASTRKLLTAHIVVWSSRTSHLWTLGTSVASTSSNASLPKSQVKLLNFLLMVFSLFREHRQASFCASKLLQGHNLTLSITIYRPSFHILLFPSFCFQARQHCMPYLLNILSVSLLCSHGRASRYPCLGYPDISGAPCCTDMNIRA